MKSSDCISNSKGTENNPCIAVLMAIYRPREDWFREQLISLNEQDYPNIRIYIRDDNSPDLEFERAKKIIEESITRVPYEIKRNVQNVGSNSTFEKLTKEAEGQYFAYCDQDDIWEKQKLSKLKNLIEKESALLACSDMKVIDGAGNLSATSMLQVRKHLVFREGEGLARFLLFSNFVSGCAMLIKADVAKDAIPFCPFMVHDHFLALFASERGRLAFTNEKLINYRIHGANQSLPLVGVKDKDSYVSLRIEKALMKMEWLRDNFICEAEVKKCILEGIEWYKARKDNMMHAGGRKIVWKYRAFGRNTALFELVAPYMPQKFFMIFIELNRKNII